MSATFNVNEYWLKRGRDYIAEHLPDEYHRLQEQFLVKILKSAGIPFPRILDLGCGFGRISRVLAANFPEAIITAVDLSVEQLENARRYCEGHSNIAFATYDFYSEVPLPGGSYDLVVAIEVFLHHPGPFLRQLLQRIATASHYIVNVDWSEDWPWPRPEHTWIHDYSVLYRELGLENVSLRLPERVNGLQQRLFLAARNLPEAIRNLPQESMPAAHPPPPMVEWYTQLHHAIADVLLFVPQTASLILVNDDAWGAAETALHPRRVQHFLESDGKYCGPPPDDATAIAELTRLHQAGATHIAVPWHCFWWLEHYVDFARYLHHGCKCLLANDRISIFQLAA